MEKKFSEDIAKMFEVTDEELRRGMEDFMEEMARGLDDPSTSTLYMEPCYVALPSGKERGKALALDFGGTNARASLIELTSDGLHVVRQVARPLRKAGAYDVTTKDTSREALFDFLAELVADVLAGEDAALPLGHTFSYGTHQEELRDARLLVWSKEIAVPGVEGEMVNALLEEALRRKGLAVTPTAILNDTVAVLLAAAFRVPDTAIGTIYATGFNSCYLETFSGERPPMVYNIESGSYGHFPQNAYDKALDAESAKPGAQKLEKMISGRYLGDELPAYTGEDVSRLATQGTEAEQRVARALIRRSARLAAMTLAAVLRHRADDDHLSAIPPQPLAIDGSVFEHMPGVEQEMRLALQSLITPAEESGLTFTLEKDASGTGAAIAAILGNR